MPWYDTDTFWNLGYRFMFGPNAWERAPTEAEQVLALLRLEPGARILDLCCGPGRHSVEMARRGYRVTGVDLNAAYLDRAAAFAGSEGVPLELVRADMREFRRPEAFDAAVNLFTSFGYFEDPRDDRAVVSNLYASLRAGGRLAFDMMSKEIVARAFVPRDWYEVDDVVQATERWVDPGWEWMRNRHLFFTPTGRHEVRVDHRLYSGAELRGLMETCGFQNVQLFGSLAGQAYDRSASRLVAVGEK